MQNIQDHSKSASTGKVSASETIRQLAQRHLKDQNHTTTDEELKNAKVELSEEVLVYEKNLSDEGNSSIGYSQVEINRERVPNPYDILGS